jgi:hypothetical protein
MKNLKPGELFAWLWFYLLQPALFFFGVSVFLHGVYQSIWG